MGGSVSERCLHEAQLGLKVAAALETLAPALEARLPELPRLLDGAAEAGQARPGRLSLATDGLEEDSLVVAAPPLGVLPGGELEIELLGRRLRPCYAPRRPG